MTWSELADRIEADAETTKDGPEVAAHMRGMAAAIRAELVRQEANESHSTTTEDPS